MTCIISVHSDPRVVTNLIDGVNRTTDDIHMWLCPFTNGEMICCAIWAELGGKGIAQNPACWHQDAPKCRKKTSRMSNQNKYEFVIEFSSENVWFWRCWTHPNALLSRARNGRTQLMLRKKVCATAVAHRWNKKTHYIYCVSDASASKLNFVWLSGGTFHQYSFGFYYTFIHFVWTHCSSKGPNIKENLCRKLQNIYIYIYICLN